MSLLPGILSKSPFRFLRDLVEEHGDLVRLKFGSNIFYVVSNPDYFQHILRDNQRNYVKSDAFYSSGRLIVGNGLITSDGDFWLRQRRMMQPHFHRQQITALSHVMMESIEQMLGGWLAPGQTEAPMDVRERMSEITINVTTRVIFGSNTLSQEELHQANDDQLFIIKYVALRGYTVFLPGWVPIPGTPRFNQTMQRTRERVQRIIDQVRAKGDQSNTLISMLINTVDEETDERMTDQQLMDEAMSLFIAGFETTATLMTWLFYVLSLHPQVEARLLEEIDTVVGSRRPTFDDLMQLPYCRKVIQETLRFYPPVGLLPRTSQVDDMLGEHPVPGKTLFLMFYYGLHHNGTYWEAPETFDPERFSPVMHATQHRFAYMPFSTGPRKCIGDEFAMIEATLMLVMILQRYRVRVQPVENMTPVVTATLIPNKPIRATVTRR